MDTNRSTSAGIYVRISSDPQGLRAGIDRQEADCRALAESRGWDVIVYSDNDLSAYSGKTRPGYQRMLSDIGDRSIGAIVTWHLDRLTRSPKELEHFFEVCDQAGMKNMATVTGDIDLSTSDGRLQARIMGAVARKSSDDTSRRLKRKFESLAQEGKYGGGRRPFGYERDGVTLRAEEADLIRGA
ncbi:MAG: recombinase family protein, partial [Actinomycetota bacterium]